MKRLIDGFRRFHDRIYLPRADYYKRLAAGQHPRYLFITCSDSRVRPHLFTGADAGDLFMLRNIGNIVPPHGLGQTEAEAVIEYALAALEVRHVILCGHSDCGAMKGLLHPEHLTGLPAVSSWLTYAAETRARVLAKYGHLGDRERVEAAVRENVLVQLDRLRELPAVAPRLADGRLEVHGWVYAIEDGDILAYDPSRGEFLPLSSSPLTNLA